MTSATQFFRRFREQSHKVINIRLVWQLYHSILQSNLTKLFQVRSLTQYTGGYGLHFICDTLFTSRGIWTYLLYFDIERFPRDNLHSLHETVAHLTGSKYCQFDIVELVDLHWAGVQKYDSSSIIQSLLSCSETAYTIARCVNVIELFTFSLTWPWKCHATIISWPKIYITRLGPVQTYEGTVFP